MNYFIIAEYQSEIIAQANKIIAESLKDGGEAVIDLRKVDKWDGVLPKVNSNGNGQDVMLNVDSLTK